MRYLVFFITALVSAQQWSGVISTGRAPDESTGGGWANAGISGGIPSSAWTQCGSTVAAYSGSASTINTAIAACGSNQYVHLGTGSFTLSSGIDFGGKSSVVLRGDGADQTIILSTGNVGCNGADALICIAGGNNSPGGESNVCDWTSGYSQGATTITLSNCGSTTPSVGAIGNLKVGSLIVLDQVDEANDTGAIWNCLQGVGTSTARCASEGTGFFARTDGTTVASVNARSQQQVVRVTQCDSNSSTGHACSSGTNITISPGLYMPNWTTTQKPQAWYAGSYVSNSGVENLSINANNGSTNPSSFNITLMSCDSCWVSGVRSMWAGRAHVRVFVSKNCTIQNSYFFQDFAHATQSYAMELVNAADNLIVNNIWQKVTDSTPTCNGGCEGNVIAYNFAIASTYSAANWLQASYYDHASGDAYNLLEGNIGVGFTQDQIHGTHHFYTLFRNFLMGWQLQCQLASTPDNCTTQTSPIYSYSGSRYDNFVGNVLGTPTYHTQYQCIATSTSSCSGANVSIYDLGFTDNQDGSGNATNNTVINGYCTTQACSAHSYYDNITVITGMRWGNYDVVNAANQWTTGEVPSGLTLYSNAVPTSSCTSMLACPSSFYLSAKPSWWGSRAWPGIGPEISGGNIGQCSGGTYAKMPSDTTAHCIGGGTKVSGWNSQANMNPAMDCAINTMGMPVDGSGSVLSFNAGTCYTVSSSSGSTSNAGPVSRRGPIVSQ